MLLSPPLCCGGASEDPTFTASSKAPVIARAFPLSAVRLLDGPFRQAMERDIRYLVSLEPDRLLHNFRVAAGLPSAAQPLGGWEAPKCEVRGHSVGHYLSACALGYAASRDERLKARVETLVVELAKCQAALAASGSHAGYLSAFPESFFDRVDARKPVWAPWYTLHKILAGLLDAHVHCGSRQALAAADKLGDWVWFRMQRLSLAQQQAMLETEFGGMNEALANLSAASGKPAHLRTAQTFDHRRVFDPLAAGKDELNGLHANTQIPKIIGAAREYELTGQTRYRTIAQRFWKAVALDRSYCIGGHSDNEHFFPVDSFAKHLQPATCETCNTYNMLKLTRHLFAWAPSAATMDFYERALLNHILASQEPQQGALIYFATLKPGHFKTYSLPTDSFWCCVGTGMENHVRYAETVYFHDDQTLWLNLFVASELNWRDKGLVVRQETRFPDEDSTRLTFRCAEPVRLALKIRQPAWAQSIAMSVNGQAIAVNTQPSSYVAIERMWRDGDRVEIRLPMQLRLENLPGAPNIAAVCFGPVVLAGELGTEGLREPMPYAVKQLDYATVPAPRVPVFVSEEDQVLSRIKPVAGHPLAFRTQGLARPADVTLSPYFRLHHQRYNIYWHVMSAAGWEKEQAALAAEEVRRIALERRKVDDFRPGEQQPEQDHGLRGERTASGNFSGRMWRHASDGGWFSFRMKVDAQQPMTLLCTYWGGDGGPREFDILVEDQKIATQKLARNRPGEFFDVEHPLPAALVRGKKHVTVRFQAHPHKIAGGLFGCTMLRPATAK